MQDYNEYFTEFTAALREAEIGELRPYESFKRFLLLFSLSLEAANAKVLGIDASKIEEKYLFEVKQAIKPEMYAKAFSILVRALTANPGDFLGSYAMSISGSGKRDIGQCYTPDCIAQLVAQCTLQGKPKRKPWVINEPSCGAGALIIAATEQLKKAEYGKKDFYFVANDIDDTSVKMAFIQCTLLDIPVDFYTGDTLKQEYWYRRPTLAYLLNHKL